MHQLKKFQHYVWLCIVIGAMPFTQATAQISFNEIGVSAGVGSDSYDSSSRHGLGVIWVDYDNDGFPDIFASNGSGLPAHLYHNEGNGTFTDADNLLPVLPGVEMTSTMFADYDNDGDQDIYIAVGSGDLFSPDGGANILLQNQWVENGNALSTPLFIDVAAAAGVDNLPAVPFGTNPGYKSYSGGWLDYDRDGCVDLYVANMVWDQGGVNTNANQLYKNNCDGTFTDVTVSSGVDTGDDDDYRPTLAFFGGLLTPGDIDPDLYVVNVHDASPYHHDLIYENNGDGTFTEFSGTMPTFGDDSGAGMGTAVGDIDLDGDWDIYITDLPAPPVEPVMEGNTLYLGQPDGTWSENAGPTAGVASGPSWGANFTDLDLDGFEDLFVGTIAPDTQIQTIYRNDGDGTFSDVTSGSGFVTGHEARGTAAADFDRDDDIDIVQVNLNGSIDLYENVTSTSDNWLEIDLNATVSNRSAIGTLVEATIGGVTRMRQVNGGASAHSQDDLMVHFGLGSATNVDQLTISWPSGIVQTLTNVGVNQMIAVTEQTTAPGDLFTEVSAAAGVSVIHDGGALTDMGIGSGAAWFDYDNDGDQDLYMTMRTGANRLFQNNGGTFTDVAAAAGVADASHDGSGVAVADYDNDGDKDMYLSNSKEDVFFENNGDGTFTDITAGSGLGTNGARRGTSASWGDYDGDGFLDLFVSHHEPMADAGIPDDATQAQDYLYHNNGDGTFTDVSDSMLGGDRVGHSFIGAWTDYDNDGDLDLYKINDCPFESTDTMRLWRNDGGTDGVTDWTFTQVAESVSADWCQNGMGIAVGDYDRDGDMDFFYSDNGADGSVPPGEKGRAGTVLLRNDNGVFAEVTTAAGVHSAAWSWGANFFDYDLDGWQDLYLAAGEVNNDVDVESELWVNNGDGTFTNTSSESGGMNDPLRTRTSVYADYDADGDPDMFLVNYAGASKLFRNDNSNFNNWLIVDLEGTTSNRDGIGARLELQMTDGGTQYFETRSGSSLGGGDDLGAYFGLGNSTVSSLTITWPSGTVQTINSLGHNQRVLIVEDGGTGGTMILSADPTSIDFGQQDIGTASAGSLVTLTNDGTDALDVTDVSVSGVDAADFSTDFFGPVTIPGGGSTTFNTTFSPNAAAAPLAATVIYRVNVGGDLNGDWEEDNAGNPSAYVNETATAIQTTASTITLDGTVPAGTPMELFQSSRTDAAKAAPNMEWDFPVTSGDELTIRLFFAEIVRCQSGGHVFDVTIEGNTVLDEYDVFNDVGCETGTMKEFVVTAGDSNLDIDFALGGNNRPPTISAIEIESESGTGGSDIRNAQLDITHTGTNPSLTVSLTGEATTVGGNDSPVADFTFAATDLDVSFTDASTDSDGSIVSWSWDFGDGNTSTGQNPDITYAASGTYTVSLTVTDDLGATGSSSQDVTVSDGNAVPTASFTSAENDLEVTFTDGSTDSDGTIASWSWDFGDGNTSTDQNPVHTYAAYGTYTVALTVTDDGGATGSASASVTLTDPNAGGAFIEADGMVVMEAENFHTQIDRSGQTWAASTDDAGFSGASAMIASPDDGIIIDSDVTTTSPELSYDLDISTTGDYIIWVRMWAPDAGSNSVHVGVDGAIDGQSKGIQSPDLSEWVWLRLARGGNTLEQTISTAGSHTFNLWMREDGTSVDKIVMTTDAGFTPTGEGPAESPQASAPISEANRGLDGLVFGEETAVVDLPTEYALESNYPNPFNPTTTIKYDVPEASSVKLEVYDMMGRRIATLVNGQLGAGRYEATWNARSDSGAPVASGVYLYRLQAGSFEAVKRMVLMK
ncbi:MAG: FG-GAP-like repeat-containing protein [Bacteroidota bacterium]